MTEDTSSKTSDQDNNIYDSAPDCDHMSYDIMSCFTSPRIKIPEEAFGKAWKRHRNIFGRMEPVEIAELFRVNTLTTSGRRLWWSIQTHLVASGLTTELVKNMSDFVEVKHSVVTHMDSWGYSNSRFELFVGDNRMSNIGMIEVITSGRGSRSASSIRFVCHDQCQVVHTMRSPMLGREFDIVMNKKEGETWATFFELNRRVVEERGLFLQRL